MELGVIFFLEAKCRWGHCGLLSTIYIKLTLVPPGNGNAWRIHIILLINSVGGGYYKKIVEITATILLTTPDLVFLNLILCSVSLFLLFGTACILWEHIEPGMLIFTLYFCIVIPI